MGLKYPRSLHKSELGNDANMPLITFRAYKYKLPTGKLETARSEKEGIPEGDIQLYMPAGTSESVGAEWGYETLVNIQQGLAQAGADVAGIALNKAGDLAGSMLKATAGGNFGATIIPSEYMIFKKPSPYNFNLSFNFVPRSKEEGADIISIIKVFKKLTLPTIEGDGADFILKFPAVWDILFTGIKGPGSGLASGTYENMACTNCQVTYSGGANSALVFYDEVPVQCSMTLQFQSIQYSMRKE
jgi:hypothetical protein